MASMPRSVGRLARASHMFTCKSSFDSKPCNMQAASCVLACTLQQPAQFHSTNSSARRHTRSISSVRRFLTDLCILSRSEVRCVLSGPSVLTLLMMPIKKAPLLLTRRKSLLPKLSTADWASASDNSATDDKHQIPASMTQLMTHCMSFRERSREHQAAVLGCTPTFKGLHDVVCDVSSVHITSVHQVI